MRIFLDTNVLASAMTTRGLCWELLEKVILEQDFITAQPVMDELSRILALKFKVPPDKITETVKYLLESAELSPGAPPVLPECPDPADAIILACALAAGTKFFVTGDKALLEMVAVEGMPIVSPRECWDRLARMG